MFESAELGHRITDRAVCDMVERTSNESAPWILVPANDKYSAWIRVTLCERIAAAF